MVGNSTPFFYPLWSGSNIQGTSLWDNGMPGQLIMYRIDNRSERTQQLGFFCVVTHTSSVTSWRFLDVRVQECIMRD